MTVKKSIADLISALRSGEYKKGRGALQVFDKATQEHSYCCEGVMSVICEVPVHEIVEDSYQDGVLVTRFAKPNGGPFNTFTSSFAPDVVWEGLGVETGDGGEILMLEIPCYQYEGHKVVDGSIKWDLEYRGWFPESFASLNDFLGRNETDEEMFTFDQIADLMEWAYVRNYGNA